jgi:acetyl esterase/lipase
MKAILGNQVKLISRPAPVPATVEEMKDIEYGQTAEKTLKLDLYMPKGLTKPTPALIFVHGGGWESGDRSDYQYYLVKFAEAGYVATSISYRLKREALFPAPIQDCKRAVEWLRANAKEYHIDPKHIAMIGGSAGGYLSMMVGYAKGEAMFEPEGSSGDASIQAVVDCYGPTDLTAPEAREHPTITSFFGKPSSEVPDVYEKASPMHYVKKGLPPTLIFQGTIDELVPVAQPDRLAEKLKEVGVPVVYDRIEGWPHTMDMAQGVNDHMFAVMKAFFTYYLGRPNPPAAG